MYEQVFNLTSRPFTSMHYVKHYFPAKDIDQTLQVCTLTIDRGTGPVVVVGDHGTGKTLLLAMLEGTFKTKFGVVNISATGIHNREDLLQNILYQLKIYKRGLSENDMRMDLMDHLRNDGGDGLVLMVDDAQKLDCESIEELQMLLDLIREGSPHVRLVLAGSRGLEDRLADSRLVAFNQRIAGRGFLGCLSRDETEAYVRAHLERAGGKPDELFSPEAYRAIQDVSEGRPRFINQVCDHAMIFSATRGIIPITDSIVREAWFDIQKLPGSVAPEGAGASVAETPIVTQGIESEEDGWTVIEFGDLPESESEPESIEGSAATGATLVDADQSEQAAPAETESEPVATESETETETETETAAESEPATTERTLEVKVFEKDEMAAMEAAATEAATESTTATGLGVPTALGGAAILASAMQGFGVSQEQEDAPRSEEEPTSNEAAPEAAAESTVTEQLTGANDGQPSQVVAEDPFQSFDYDNEEVLTDAYSPFVAQQNQRSLDLTSEQLQGLTPADMANDESPLSSEDATPDVQAEESFPTFDTAMQPTDPARESVMPTPEPRDSLETRDESAALGPNSLTDEFHVNRSAVLPVTQVATTEPVEPSEQSLEPTAQETADASAAAAYVPLDPEASPVPPANEVESAPVAQAEQSSVEQTSVEQSSEQVAAPNEAVADSAPEEKFHVQVRAPQDSHIREQAAEIIRSLNASDDVSSDSFTVSHETPLPAEPTLAEETNAIEAMIQRSIEARKEQEPPAPAPAPVVMPDVNSIQQALQSAQESNGFQSDIVASKQPVEPEEFQTPADEAMASQGPQATSTEATAPASIPVQMADDPVQPEREILQQVQEQVAMVAETNAAPTQTQDDRDILAINESQPAPSPAAVADSGSSGDAELPSWTQQDPSTGDAARIDYQKLFDQLRNVPGQEQ